MLKPFVRAVLTTSMVAGVLVAAAGPAAAEEWSIVLPDPTGKCYDIGTTPNDPDDKPTATVCP